MKILLTGATGYIGKRLVLLLAQEHQVICAVRDAERMHVPDFIRGNVEIREVDFLDPSSLSAIPEDIDAAYYLIHSMSSSRKYFELEESCATHFCNYIERTHCQHVIYLGGISNEDSLSQHLSSRKNVEEILSQGSYAFTSLRAGIIIGSGSASFEIIRDLVEKLPIMITPRWLNTLCQPIGIADVLTILTRVLLNPHVFDQTFDIGGPNVLSYKQMLLGYADVRGLRRLIITLPVMTPRLSSYWLYFVTSTSYDLATALVDSMKIEVVCRSSEINDIVRIRPMTYHTALQRAFDKIANNEITSSWKDAYASSNFQLDHNLLFQVPTFGCFKDCRKAEANNRETTIHRIWKIGGSTGWYYGNLLWEIRGFIDKIFGGVGLRRGRTKVYDIEVGDALDFWRVLYANKKQGRLLLFAEMRLPGDAWLEFKVDGNTVTQTATFRPLGLLGRIYWYCVLPFHSFIFRGMLRELTK